MSLFFGIAWLVAGVGFAILGTLKWVNERNDAAICCGIGCIISLFVSAVHLTSN